MAGQTIVVRRPESPWLRALLPVAMNYIGGQVAEGRERAARAAQNQAELDLFRAMTQGTEGAAEEQAAPTLYDMAPDAVAARAAAAMRGQAGSYAPPRLSPEEMYERLLRPRERTAVPSEQEVLMRGVNSPYAKRVGLEGVKRTADMANAMYAPARAEAAARERDRMIGELLPRGGDLRSDPNGLAAAGMRLAAAGYDPKDIFKIAYPNHSFEDVDLGDRRAFGAFDPVTGRARLETHAVGVDPTRAMEQRETTRRTAMEKSASGATDKAGNWRLVTDEKGNQFRVNMLTGQSVPTGIRTASQGDPVRARALEAVKGYTSSYQLGIDAPNVPEDVRENWMRALAIVGDLSGGGGLTPEQRARAREVGMSEEELARLQGGQ